MTLRITLEIGDYSYSEDMEQENGDGTIWSPEVKRLIEVTSLEMLANKDTLVQPVITMIKKELNVLFSDANNLREQVSIQ